MAPQTFSRLAIVPAIGARHWRRVRCDNLFDPRRRRLLQGALAAIPAVMAMRPADAFAGEPGAAHDFDFFLGDWRVAHRRLRKRLAGSDDWEEFGGTTRCQSLFGGLANMNESVTQRRGRTSHGLGLRAFDPRSATWADWYLSGADPTQIGVPGVGRFAGGIGTFLSDETFEGQPVKVRGQFQSLSADVAQWDQAFSIDDGATWETNWVMRYTRTA